MSALPSAPPSHAWGFLRRHQFPVLPPHPSSTQAGHPHCRAVASYDITGAIQHFVLPLDRTKPPTLAHQVDIFKGFWENSPMGCRLCRALFASAVSVADRCAFTFLEACHHQVPTEEESHSDSDSDDSHRYGSDDESSDSQDDDAENLATALITEDVGYNPIVGNLVIVKHTIVDHPVSVMEAQILDVLVEDFPVLHGLVLRSIVGDWEDASRRFLPSLYIFTRRGSGRANETA
ncbi:hypothetical protein C8F01DRAFT_1266131 [Mycena amicta]|nr:hypothetical protein C8F01DRAFT_1266131 [Mycena amicta]